MGIENSLFKVKNTNNPELVSKYYKSLKQKYSAVCFDIDGTLTNSNNITDDVLLEQIYNLLKRRVPIVFITGRGRTGTNSFINNLYNYLSFKYSLKTDEFSRIFALVNDSTLLLSTSKDSKKLLDSEKILVDNDALKQLKKINELIPTDSFSKYCEKTYSYSNLQEILNIRFVFDKNNAVNADKLLFDIKNVKDDNNLDKIEISFGYWKDKFVLQLGLSNKGKGIKLTEKIIGVPENSMLRVGDCGSIKGNDYELLNCPQGFSVKEYSDSIEGCFPVIDQNTGNILEGINATKYLLNNMKILPTICLEKADIKSYKKQYAQVEQIINKGKHKIFAEYNQKIDFNFKLNLGLEGLFEKNIGGIIMPFYEWELIPDDNQLKRLFAKVDDNNCKLNCLFTDENVLLRGSNNYYYFLKERVLSNDGSDPLDYKTVFNWHHNYCDFFIDSVKALRETNQVEIIHNKKLLLGILDNIRNYFLINLNAEIVSNHTTNTMLNLEKINKNEVTYKIYKVLLDNTALMKQIIFDNEINPNAIEEQLISVINESKKMLINFKNSDKDKNYSKIYRLYREIDSFIENYITVDFVSKHYLANVEEECIGIAGLLYGGIELPIIFKNKFHNVSDISLLKFSSEINSYRKKQSVEVRNFDIFDYGDIDLIDIDLKKRYLLADDNLLTAKTMQLALNSMFDKNIDIKNVLIVRYPSLNRIDQMFMDGHGAVDYRFFFDLIIGLTSPSPYTLMDIPDSYLDSLGVFDKTRQKILETLFKNHDYQAKSEVALIKSIKK